MRTFLSKSIGRMTVGALLLCAPAPIVFSACTNLTEVPKDALTPENAFGNQAEVLAGVASVYASLRSTMDDRYNLAEVTTDEIIVPTPCFVAYEREILFADGVPVTVTCRAENNFEIPAEEIEPLITSRTKAIFLGFPNNPTGACLSRENARGVGAALRIVQAAQIVTYDDYADTMARARGTLHAAGTCFGRPLYSHLVG